MTPDLVRRFREAEIPDHEIQHWMELKQACGYTDDEILEGAIMVMRTRLRRIRGW